MAEKLISGEISDAELVANLRAARSPGAQNAIFEIIYERHADAVLRACAWHLPEDLATAESAAQEALTVAFADLTQGRPPQEPDKLREWLCGIGRNRCRVATRHRDRPYAFRENLTEDDYESASRARLAEVDRILGVVAGSLTPKQRRIYELSTLQRLRGRQLAAALGVKAEQAYRAANENKIRLAQAFGAYVLAQEGRPYCPGLAAILDEAAWDGESFGKVLRLRIIRHLGNCPTCANCSTCQVNQRKFVGPLAPALLPILAFGTLHHEVMSALHLESARTPSRPGKDRRPPGSSGSGPRGRSLLGTAVRGAPLPALAGATIAVTFVLALLVTHFGVAHATSHRRGGPPLPLAQMPTLAYATTTSLITRKGSGPPRVLASPPPGTVVAQVAWSPDGRWIGWTTGPAGAAATQVHLTEVASKTTHTWSCGGACGRGSFVGTSFVLTSGNSAALLAYPETGGAPSTTPLPSTIVPGGPLATTPDGAAVVLVSQNFPKAPRMLRVQPGSAATLMFGLPRNAVPGGDRNPGSTGEVGVSADGTIVAYGSSFTGTDPGIPSDWVTIVDLSTNTHRIVELPVDSAHPLRIAAVWIDSAHRIWAAAWHQPGDAAHGRVPDDFRVTPAIYRLDGDQWTLVSGSGVAGDGGPGGWTAVIPGEIHFAPNGGTMSEDLFAQAGTTRVRIASGVTAFAWAPPPRGPAIQT